MTTSLNPAIVRIRTADDRVIGAGFLVGQRKVLTCAHVVAQALGMDEDATEVPQGEVVLDFPLIAPERRLTARVVLWQPAESGGAGDIAGLEMLDEPPGGAQPVRLVRADESWGHAFRAFGFPHGYENGVWASGRILGQEATGWLQIGDVKQTGYFVAPGFSGGPVWDETLDGIVGMTVAADTTQGVRAAFIIPTDRLVTAWSQLATWAIPPCPYRGLLAFREQDAPFFFGREAFAERLVEAVAGRTLTVAVVGPSGSGKSSVVFAGLLPRLRQAHGDEEWTIARLRPGSQPFNEVANALLPLLEPEMTRTDRLIELPKLAGALRRGDVALSSVTAKILEQNPDAGHLLLVIDQFEELYTLCPDSDTRHAFLDHLIQAVPQPNDSRPTGFRLVLTLRADFLGQALAYRSFADLLDQAEKLILGPMNREELEATILCPAERQGVAFEEGLMGRILDDVGSEPGSLPLLEFALTQLWERQEGNRLTHAAYEAIGAVEGALLCYADRVYEGLSELEQEQARQVFVQLVRPGEGTEDTRRLTARPELGEEHWLLVQKLADARLVVTGRDPAGQEMVEIAHEALIQRWGRLRTWMEENRDFRMWQEQLRAALRQWEGGGRDTGALLRGAPLIEAREWLEEKKEALEQNARAFIRASIARARRIKWLTVGGIALAFLVVSALGLVAWGQRNTALDAQAMAVDEANARATAQAQAEVAREQAEKHAQIAVARHLSSQASIAIDRGLDAELSLLLAVQAIKLIQEVDAIPNVHADATLRRALELAPELTIRYESCDCNSLLSYDFDASYVEFDPSGRYLAAEDICGTSEKRIRFVDLETKAAFGSVPKGEDIAGWSPRLTRRDDHESISPNGERRVIISDDQIALMNAATGDEITRFSFREQHPYGEVTFVRFSPDSKWLAFVYAHDVMRPATLYIWDATGGETIATIPHLGWIIDIGISPNSMYVVTLNSSDPQLIEPGPVHIWRAENGNHLRTIRHTYSGDIYDFEFSDDGKYFVTVGVDGTIRLWTSEDFHPPGIDQALGMDDNILKEDDYPHVYASGQAVYVSVKAKERRVFNHQSLVESYYLSRDASTIATVTEDGQIHVWDIYSGELLISARGESHSSVRFSDDGTTLAIDIPFSSVEVWAIQGPDKRTVIIPNDGMLMDSVLNANGSRLVTLAGIGFARRNLRSATLWDIEESEDIRVFDGGTIARFSPNGYLLAIGTMNGTVHIVDPIDGEEKRILKYEAEIGDLCFAPKGNLLAIATRDDKIIIWDAQNSMEVSALRLQFRVQSISFNQDGTELRCTDTEGSTHVWPASIDKLVDLACRKLTRNLSIEEWNIHVGKNIPYHQTCPELPIWEE